MSRFALLFTWVAASAFAQPRQVAVGRVECVAPKKQVKRYQVSVPDGAANVRAWFDTGQNRLCFEGLQPGDARVVMTGTFRKIIVGSALREEEQPFSHGVSVRVLGLRAEVNEIPVAYALVTGQVRRAQLSVFLGAAFSTEAERGLKWRHVEVASSGEAALVRVTADRVTGRQMLEVRGAQPGRVVLTLRGERAVNGAWQRVERTLKVEVAAQR